MADDLASAKQKLRGNDNAPPFNFDSLPLDRENDSIWSEIRSEYGLTLPELSALKNARCQRGVKKKNSKLENKNKNNQASFLPFLVISYFDSHLSFYFFVFSSLFLFISSRKLLLKVKQNYSSSFDFIV
jgi:hypothetical protein